MDLPEGSSVGAGPAGATVGICGCNQWVVPEPAGTINGFIRKTNRKLTQVKMGSNAMRSIGTPLRRMS